MFTPEQCKEFVRLAKMDDLKQVFGYIDFTILVADDNFVDRMVPYLTRVKVDDLESGRWYVVRYHRDRPSEYPRSYYYCIYHLNGRYYTVNKECDNLYWQEVLPRGTWVYSVPIDAAFCPPLPVVDSECRLPDLHILPFGEYVDPESVVSDSFGSYCIRPNVPYSPSDIVAREFLEECFRPAMVRRDRPGHVAGMRSLPDPTRPGTVCDRAPPRSQIQKQKSKTKRAIAKASRKANRKK